MNNIDNVFAEYGLHLKMTSIACPEQYDVIWGMEQVGYMRLRHGYFTVHVPDPSGDIVYSAEPEGDGIFYEDERIYYMTKAAEAIYKSLTPNYEETSISL